MSAWLLVFVLFVNGNGAAVSQVYDSRFDCEVKMGVVADQVQDDPRVGGWVVPVPCVEIKQAGKI